MNCALQVLEATTNVVQALPGVVLPDPAPAAPPGGQVIGSLVLSWLKWGGLIVAAALLMVAFIMNMRSNKKGEASEAQEQIIRILVSVAGVMGAVSIITFIVAAATSK